MKHSFLIQIDVDEEHPLVDAQKLAEVLLESVRVVKPQAMDIEVQYLGAN